MKKYDSLNGIRTIACIGILMMHILSNGKYEINSILGKSISNLTNFTFLFMILSSFSMCCGYYEKFKNNEISLERFYKRRITKILPFFLFLICVDVLYEHNLPAVVEGFADITLLFGFIPNSLSVIGVGWFIGLIFIFYIMFPFFVTLFSNKKQAWAVTIISLLMNISSAYYFDLGRNNMFYSFMYFCLGGLLYLYKDSIINLLNKNRAVSGLIVLIASVLFLIGIDNVILFTIKIVFFSICIISYGISFDKSLLNSKFTKYIGGISLEIYLSHMLIYRVVEKIKAFSFINNQLIQYVATCIVVIIGSIVLAKVFNLFMVNIEKRIRKNESFASK